MWVRVLFRDAIISQAFSPFLLHRNIENSTRISRQTRRIFFTEFIFYVAHVDAYVLCTCTYYFTYGHAQRYIYKHTSYVRSTCYSIYPCQTTKWKLVTYAGAGTIESASVRKYSLATHCNTIHPSIHLYVTSSSRRWRVDKRF